MRESWREYRRLAWRHAAELVGGALSGLLGIALSIHPLALPAWVWFLLALASACWLGFRIFHDIRLERDEALRRLDPQLACRLEGFWSHDDDQHPNWTVFGMRVEFTNREPEKMSIRFSLMFERDTLTTSSEQNEPAIAVEGRTTVTELVSDTSRSYLIKDLLP